MNGFGLQTEGKLRLRKLYFLQAVRRGFDGAHLLEENANLEGIVQETGSVGTGFAGKIVGDRRVFGRPGGQRGTGKLERR